MKISKHFKSLKQAERYQWNLYNKYSYVKLVSFPLFGEDGIYVWNVIEPTLSQL